ncbi:MAG: 16S rRNA (guanine(527)-N(7))-methyltransferase RsmG [Thermoleophilia bacterium]
MDLAYREEYQRLGLSPEAFPRLELFGDLLLSSPANVTGLRDPADIETRHFLDSLSLLALPEVEGASRIVDVGSGGGLPGLILALALPSSSVTAVESVQKKCRFISSAAEALELANVRVICTRAEEFGRGEGRERFDLAVARALAPLPVVGELTVPLVRVGGVLVAMKGAMSNQESMDGAAALVILGAEPPEIRPVAPFAGIENRAFVVARKSLPTPQRYPRRDGMPAKRPLGRKDLDGVKERKA